MSMILRIDYDQNPPLTAREVLRLYVKFVIDAQGGNKSRAAKILGIDRRSLYRVLADKPRQFRVPRA